MANRNKVKPASVSSVGANRIVVMRLSIAVWIILVIILLGLSFWGGALYGNEISSSSVDSGVSANSLIHRHYAVGLVVYISQTAITISSEETNFNQTFAISASTLISINGAKSTPAQIKPGNIVLIQEDKYDSSKANVILVNSHFRG